MIKEIFEALKYIVECFILFEVILLFTTADIYFICIIVEKVKDWWEFNKPAKKG